MQQVLLVLDPDLLDRLAAAPGHAAMLAKASHRANSHLRIRGRRSVELRAEARCYSFVDGGGWITPYFYRPVNPSVLASSPSKATLSEYQFGQNVNSRIQAAGCRRANAFKPCAIAPAAWRYSPRSAAFKTAYNKWRNRLIARASDLVSHPAAADLSFFGQTTAARLPC
jgi:hypothetical protein